MFGGRDVSVSSLQFRVFGKIAFFLLAMGLVASAYQTYIEHSWENVWWLDSNPDVVYVHGEWVWMPFSPDNRLTLLRLPDIPSENLDPAESGLLSQAKDGRADASYLREKCVEELEYLERIPEIKEYRETFSMVMLPVPLAYIAARAVIELRAGAEEREHFEKMVEYCSGYGIQWQKTATSSMDALSSSFDKVDSNYSHLWSRFDEINHSGLCDADYHGAGKSDCLAVKSALATIESGSIEGSYGGYNLAYAQLDAMKKEVKKTGPNFANYSLVMNLIWEKNGVLGKMGMLSAKAEQALADAENEYISYKYTADNGKANAALLNSKLAAENPGKISAALQVSGSFGASPAGTIADRYAQLSHEMKEAEGLYSEATRARSTKTMKGYMKAALNSMKQADAKYASLEVSLPVLHADAASAVEHEKIEAASLLAEAKKLESLNATSSYVRGKINLSATYFEQAENKQDLGSKFELYALSAKEARTAISKNQNQSFDQAAEIAAKKKELLDLIGKAEADGINVYSQKESLNSLNSADYAWVEAKLAEIEQEMIVAAQLEYGYLDDMRAGLISQIKLVGGDADDLLTDMQKEESGLIGKDGRIDYRKAIGSLRVLSDKYSEIQSSLDSEISKIVKNSLMVESKVFVDTVELDKQSTITIDLIIINTEKYSSANVPADVKLPMSVDLMYSDITSGSDLVGSIVSNGNSAKLYLKKVGPYARQRIVFETKDTIAHTTKVKRNVAGLGDGSALVEEEIAFALDSDISALAIPSHYGNALVDSKTPGALSKGNHVLTAKYVENDAYNQSIANIKSSSIGLNSQVEYDIEIIPRIGIDELMLFVDPGAKISNLNVFTLSGESVGSKKKITDNRYSFLVSGMTAGNKASVRVSYILENASGYVQSQLLLFEDPGLSDEVGALINEAKAAMGRDDANTALAKIKEAQALQKKEAGELAKTMKKIKDIETEISLEIAEIKSALESGKGLNSSFMAKLSARSDELGRRLNESTVKEPGDALLCLESVDLKWKGKEITALRKDMFRDYNGLRERFVKTGNLTTPGEFLSVESALNKLEVSGRLEYAIELARAMEKAESLVHSSESSSIEKLAKLKTDFSRLRGSISGSLEQYTALSLEAKGTQFSSIFKQTESGVNKKVADIEKMFGNAEPEAIENSISSLDKTRQDLDKTVSMLRNQSESKLDLVQKLFNEAEGSMGEEEKAALEQKISSMQRLMAAGEYVNSLRAGNAILEDLGKKKEGDNSLVLLGVTSLAILGVVAVYMFKQNKGKQKPEKELRKLKKAEESEWEK